MTARKNPTTLIALAVVTFAFATTSFAQQKNYSSGTVNVTPSNVSTTTLNGVINSVSGTAVVNITAPNVTVTTLSGGTLSVNSASSTSSVSTTVGAIQGGNVKVFNRGTLNVSVPAGPAVTGSMAIANGGVAVFNQTVTGSYNGLMSGVGQVRKTGAGLLILTGVNTNTGLITVSAGTLRGNAISLTGNIANSSVVQFNQVADGTYAGVISGTGQLSKMGASVLTLTGANTYTGLTTVTAGTLRGNTTSLSGAIANSGVVEFNQTTNGTYAGVLSGTGQLKKDGTAVLTLTGANTYTGLTTVIQGTLSGNTTSLRGNIVNSGVVQFNQTSNGNYTGVISGTGQLSKIGTAVLTLTGANTYTGLTTVSAGTLSGNTTSLSGAIANSGVVEFNQTANGTYSGVISGTGQLRKIGTAVLTLTGANTYTGLTTVSAGTLSGNTTSLRGAIANSGVVQFNQTSNGNYTGVISGTGQLSKTGTGVLILTGANTYTGLTTVTAGTLRGNTTSLRGNIANSGVVEFNQTTNGTYAGVISGTGQLSTIGTAVLTLTGANTYTGLTTVSAGTLSGSTTSIRGNLANSGVVEFNQTTNGTFAGVISGAGQLRKIGTAVLTLTGVNTYTGLTTVSAGTLSGSTTSLLGNIVNSGVVQFNQTSNGNYTGVISGTGQLSKIGTALLTLTGANTYTGLTTVTAGTLRGNTTSLRGAISNSGVVEFNQTTNGTFAGVISGTGQLSKIGTAVLTLTGANTYTGLTTVSAGTLSGSTTSIRGNLANSGVVQFNQTTNGTFAGVISGTGQLSKIGTAVLTLTGANTYTGLTTVSAGTLSGSTTSIRGNLANSGVVEFNQTTNGTFAGVISGAGQLRKIGTAVLTLTGVNTYTGLTTVSAGTLSGSTTSLLGNIVNNGVVQFNQTSNGNYTGVISGTGQLSKIGTGVLILTGANTYTGLTTVSAGTLRGNTTSLSGNIANSGVVEFNQTTNGTFAGVISGTGQLSKIGTGTVSLSGASSYKGSTLIDTGALFIEGNQASATGAVSVALGATLGGKGTVGGPTTILSDGNHRIGASATGDQPGYQTFANALTYNAGSEVFWRLAANTTTAITAGNQNFDQAGVGSTLLISQSATFNLAFNSGGSTVNWADPFWDVAKSNSAGWQIFNAAALIANGPTVFTLNPSTQWRDSQGVLLSDVRPDYTFVFYKDEANDDLYLNYIYSP